MLSRVDNSPNGKLQQPEDDTQQPFNPSPEQSRYRILHTKRALTTGLFDSRGSGSVEEEYSGCLPPGVGGLGKSWESGPKRRVLCRAAKSSGRTAKEDET